MLFKKFCFLVVWTKVASALEGLTAGWSAFGQTMAMTESMDSFFKYKFHCLSHCSGCQANTNNSQQEPAGFSKIRRSSGSVPMVNVSGEPERKTQLDKMKSETLCFCNYGDIRSNCCFLQPQGFYTCAY